MTAAVLGRRGGLATGGAAAIQPPAAAGAPGQLGDGPPKPPFKYAGAAAAPSPASRPWVAAVQPGQRDGARRRGVGLHPQPPPHPPPPAAAAAEAALNSGRAGVPRCGDPPCTPQLDQQAPSAVGVAASSCRLPAPRCATPAPAPLNNRPAAPPAGAARPGRGPIHPLVQAGAGGRWRHRCAATATACHGCTVILVRAGHQCRCAARAALRSRRRGLAHPTCARLPRLQARPRL